MLDVHRILPAREAEPLRQAPHVRVDDDPLRHAALGRDDVRRLAPDAGEPDESSSRVGTSPSNSSRSIRIAPWSCRAFWRKCRSARCRARARRAARPGSPPAGGTSRNSVSVTRFTVTSVVCAESITEIRSSTSLRNRSAIIASGCSAASRSSTGRMRSRFGPTRRARLGDVATRHAGQGRARGP